MELTIFKALSNQTRLRLAHILFHYELSVNEIVRLLDMGQSRVSRHLKIMAEAGLLHARRDGLWVFYSTPVEGERLGLLKAILPFFEDDESFREDLRLAARIYEERARNTRQFFNSIAESWDDLNREILGDFDLPEVVAQAVQKDCDVAVDLGCGTGEVLKRLLLSARNVIGVDGSARMLELCAERLGRRENSDRVSLRIGDLSHLPLANQEAGFACVNLALHHLSAPGEMLGEAWRVLAPGGRLFIADFQRHENETMRARFGDHWLGFDMAELIKNVERKGFALIKKATHPALQDLSLMLLTFEKIVQK